MEVKGQLITSSSYSSADVLVREPGAQLRLQELLERQRALREALGLRVAELRRVCLQEAELTGKLPPEYPLEPGERPQPIRRRAAPTYRGPRAEAQELCRELAVQRQVVEAARRLALAPELSDQQRRRRRRVQAEAVQRLRELEGQLGETQIRLGTSRVVHDEAFASENSSLSESASHENDDPHSFYPPKAPERPSPPRSRDHLRAVSSSPDRRPGWRAPPLELCGGVTSRRSSLASPTSPNRTLPRSVSSFEGRSVPATPVLSRNSCSGTQNFSRPDAPPAARQWSGSQDSQLGPPSRDLSTDRDPPPFAARTRRSNSSEALIERGGPPEEPPFCGTSRPPYTEILLDYYLERQCWPGGDHLSRRDAPPPSSLGYPESPLPRRAGRAKSCGPPPQSQPPPIAPQRPPRAVHKALALEGLRNWYLRNAGGAGAALPPPRDRRGGPPRGWPDPHPWPETGGYLPHSLSYAGQPLQNRYGCWGGWQF
uniref:Coiled-coil domain containing 120 n=1 Tax=Pelusios castaneus TaxID=367368 RepID=A0A8C8RJM4_9SAUR